MREKVYDFLIKNREISGEEISRALGISRAAVGKHIQALRGEGYEISAAARRGYCLKAAPNLPLPREIRRHLIPLGSDIPWHLEYFPVLDSTNTYLRGLAQEGLPEFSVIFAGAQRAGRGRLGRPWHSPKDAGLYFSLLLKPPLSPGLAQTITLCAGAAICKALEKQGFPCRLKWPNDILLEGKKLCGILTEMRCDPDTVHWQIVGIGLNLNHDAFPPSLAPLATSLRLVQGAPLCAPQMAAELLAALGREYRLLCREGFEPIRQAWLERAWLLHQPAIVSGSRGEKIGGIIRGLSREGHLLLEDDKGQITAISSGEIEA